MNFKPMLSADISDYDLHLLRFPLALSPKLDGIRCLIVEGVAYSRNGKAIRNRHVQHWASRYDLHNLDGELVVGSPTDPHCLNNTQSGIMSFDGSESFTFYVFDQPDRDCTWAQAFVDLKSAIAGLPNMECVPHDVVHNVSELLALELKYLQQGYEGIMVRDPRGSYKFGRATVREHGLMKLKRFQDGEALVIGVEEGSINENELGKDELGRAKRSSAGDGMRPSGMVGTLIAMDTVWGELRIAPGKMTHAQRRHFWLEPSHIIGKKIHWRSFGYGVKDKPRFPRFYGVREDV